MEALQEAQSVLSRHVVGDATIAETLAKVTELSLAAFPHASYAGITSSVDGRLCTTAGTAPVIAVIDQAQYDADAGPCVGAFRTGQVGLVCSTLLATEFAEFCAAAREHGVLSVLSLPMLTTSATIGALNLYASSEDAFSSDDVERAQAFATQAAFVVVNASAYWEARALSDNLRQAMASRAEIEQAKGIIIATTGVSADAAFEQLVKESQRGNVKLRDLAVELVRRAQRGAG